MGKKLTTSINRLYFLSLISLVCLVQDQFAETPSATVETQVKENSIWQQYQTMFAQPRGEDSVYGGEQEFERYFNEPLQPPSTKVLQYWNLHIQYEKLRLLAKKYLCVPPATVFSERLFSTAGLICDKKRNRLDPERVKMLVFLKKNLPSFK